MSYAPPAPDETNSARRMALAVRENPRTDRDYIVSVYKSMTAPQKAGALAEITCHIRYVPDRLVCDTLQLEKYFKLLAWTGGNGIEEMANTIADDFCNEVIPRWVSVNLTLPYGEFQSGVQTSVHVEDRQPNWDNPSLLQQPQLRAVKFLPSSAAMGQIKPLR